MMRIKGEKGCGGRLYGENWHANMQCRPSSNSVHIQFNPIVLLMYLVHNYLIIKLMNDLWTSYIWYWFFEYKMWCCGRESTVCWTLCDGYIKSFSLLVSMCNFRFENWLFHWTVAVLEVLKFESATPWAKLCTFRSIDCLGLCIWYRGFVCFLNEKIFLIKKF